MKWIIAVVFALVVAAATSAQQASASLSEVESLKLQLHDARTAIAQTSAQLNACLLVQERAKLANDILKDRPGFDIDWKTLKLVTVPPPAKPK